MIRHRIVPWGAYDSRYAHHLARLHRGDDNHRPRSDLRVVARAHKRADRLVGPRPDRHGLGHRHGCYGVGHQPPAAQRIRTGLDGAVGGDAVDGSARVRGTQARSASRRRVAVLCHRCRRHGPHGHFRPAPHPLQHADGDAASDDGRRVHLSGGRTTCVALAGNRVADHLRGQLPHLDAAHPHHADPRGRPRLRQRLVPGRRHRRPAGPHRPRPRRTGHRQGAPRGAAARVRAHRCVDRSAQPPGAV